MSLRPVGPAKIILVSLLLLWVAGCASVPPQLVRHYQGNWEIGEVYSGFESLDGRLVCDLDMPDGSNRYFLRRDNPGYHAWEGGVFSAAYVDVDGYVTSGYDPLVRAKHRVLHVTRVYRIGPPTAGYIKERTTRPH